MRFGKAFEERFVAQKFEENRHMEDTLDLGWKLLTLLPREELTRLDDTILDEYYKKDSSDKDEDTDNPLGKFYFINSEEG